MDKQTLIIIVVIVVLFFLFNRKKQEEEHFQNPLSPERCNELVTSGRCVSGSNFMEIMCPNYCPVVTTPTTQ